MENLDYRVGFNVDSSTVSSLQSLVSELSKIQDALRGINTTGVKFGVSGGGGGGFGGGGGGGYGGGGASRNASASASGMAAAFDEGDLIDRLFGVSESDPINDQVRNGALAGATSAASRGKGGNKTDGWRNWAAISGFNAVAYGLEDMYYAGFRGAMNNVGFVAQGIGSAFMSNQKAMLMAGVGALAATGGAMLYDNREAIFGEEALGSREDSIFGLPTRTESGRYDKLASDAMFYADRYGLGSRLGQSYTSEAAANIARAQSASTVDFSAERIASILRTPRSSDIGAAERLSSLNAPFGDIIRENEQNLWATRQNDYIERAIEDAKSKAGYLNKLTSGQILQDAKDQASADSARFSGLLMSALQGNPETLRSLEEQMANAKVSENQKNAIRNAVRLGGNFSATDSRLVDMLRSGAANPFADVEYRQRSIQSLLEGRGADPEIADQLAGAIGDDMREQQKGAMMPWEEVVGGNRNRWVGNIAASFGSIELNSRSKMMRNRQASNMQSEIYSTLLASGVPQQQAGGLASLLYREGYEEYIRSVNANQGDAGGFFAGLTEEQQMAFGQYQQNFAQIQMQYQAWRNYGRFQRSRMAFRGAR
jgi:hypothetical protein